ncbi:MAG: amidohydrolase family protein [Desulfarculaceae bacterium]|nr:amidohydrolase family protein [Desulfarculaceae bacterium]MCF8073423.1 amidohydrolase family protein [Desulfarculaceae bacterium]MCF8100430.1 amidohydrolase family protein [Desulfarculaceae bacterium]MCF8115834.1 amidohydrolase family protein [Desulfarculaceae bacterium]
MSTVLIKNVGLMLSGQVDKPILEADSILIDDGLIQKVGSGLSAPEGATVIDAKGCALTPGLIDSHCHVVLGDWTPRQLMVNFLDSSLHGGVTTSISAGEVHLPGRPKDPLGAKSLAIVAAKSWATVRPGGMKVLGGSLILEKGLTEQDIEECFQAGVRVVGEVGLGSVKEPPEATEMVSWARKRGMTVMMHTGGTSIPGSSVVGAEQIIAVNPSVASHINGGPTAVSLEGAKAIIDQSDAAIEIVQCGNVRRAAEVARYINETKQWGRVIFGNDAPSGTGVVTLGILRNMALVASLGGVAPELTVAMASGNTAALYGLNRGVIAEGREADLVCMDTPIGSPGKDVLQALAEGDTPGVSLILIDGKVVVAKSRNTPPPMRAAQVAA